ncbi:unnamed protein product, partial [Strongylus vulgaris]
MSPIRQLVISSTFQYFHKNIIVHFDLKGAPPKLKYFLDLLEFVAKSGATGILIEWEDMFPWKGALKRVRNSDAYTMEEVQQILEKAKSLRLDVIPLVQTFGHMEWILKYERFRKFRETDEYPQIKKFVQPEINTVICIGDKNAVNIVKEAIRQVVLVHRSYGIKYFHIGTDEAFEYGTCKASIEQAALLGSRENLAIKHLATVAAYTKKITRGAKILAWHDMLKNFNLYDVKNAGLGSLVQPVIWDYSETLATVDGRYYIHAASLSYFSLRSFKDFLIDNLARTFGTIWTSSAFKGADFPTAKYNRITHY